MDVFKFIFSLIATEQNNWKNSYQICKNTAAPIPAEIAVASSIEVSEASTLRDNLNETTRLANIAASETALLHCKNAIRNSSVNALAFLVVPA